MKLILLLLASFSFQAYASFPELFGSSASTVALGNQADLESAANNTYASALLGYSKSTKYSFNAFYVDTNFKDINNVVTSNDITTVNQLQTGNPKVNSSPITMFGAHLSTPLFDSVGPKFNLSIFAPFDRMMEANTGDPYQPQYSMYENRIIRPVINFSLAQSFDRWSFSLGAQTGFQSNGESYIVTKTASGNPSVGKISFNAKPSLGAIGSVAYKHDQSLSYFSIQQEMKSKFYNTATGETEVSSSSSFPFDFKVTSLLYFDPMTIRLGHQIIRENKNVFLSLEYQKWDSYAPSTLNLKKQGGVINGSQNFEDIKLRNIVIPKIGLEEKINDQWALKVGYFYRPSPFKTSNLKNAGNSIDTNKHVGSLGAAYNFIFYGKTVTLDLAYQGNFLKSEKVVKTSGREDGDPSQPKIGSPGYKIGGMIHTLALGLSWTI